jgi:3-methyladenine DNA glycosylase AlkD
MCKKNPHQQKKINSASRLIAEVEMNEVQTSIAKNYSKAEAQSLSNTNYEEAEDEAFEILTKEAAQRANMDRFIDKCSNWKYQDLSGPSSHTTIPNRQLPLSEPQWDNFKNIKKEIKSEHTNMLSILIHMILQAF